MRILPPSTVRIPRFCGMLVVLAMSAGLVAQATAMPTTTPSPIPQLPLILTEQFTLPNSFPIKGRVLFSARHDSNDTILMLDVAERRVRRIVDSPGGDSEPAWSPDGRELAFVSTRDGRPEVYVTSNNGTTQLRLSDLPGEKEAPRWSPDGSTVVFSNQTAPELRAIISCTVKSRKCAPVGINGKNYSPDISPNGQTLAFSTNRNWPGMDLCFLDRATKGERCPVGGSINFLKPRFSHNGKLLAFSLGLGDTYSLGLYDLEQSRRKDLLIGAFRALDPEWAADDSALIFSKSDVGKDHFHLELVTVQDSKSETILASETFSLRHPSWSGRETFEVEAERLKSMQQSDGTAQAN